MNLRTKLAALFSPTRRLVGVETPIVAAGGLFGGQQWVVPRAECQYRRVDLSNLPIKHRDSAARLAIERHRPTPGAVTYLGWRGGIAHLWIWATPPAVVASGEQRWLPESLLFAPPLQDEARLLRVAIGVEGQAWENRRLLSSQWWPETPSADDWQRFLRAGGFESLSEVPAVATLPWSWPWDDTRRAWLPGSIAGREQLAWLATAGLIALMLGWTLAGQVRWRDASEQLAIQLEALRTEVAPVLAARERAETAASEMDRLRALQSGISDYALMAQVAAALPRGATLKSWTRDAGKLQVLVSGGDADPRKLVLAFAGQPMLANVTATPMGDGMGLVFTLPVPAGAAP